MRISVFFDMRCSKKRTGRTYGSNSGYTYYIGVRSGKVVATIVYSKKRTTCDITSIMGEEPMVCDDCVHNYKTGSSKAMEAMTALELIITVDGQGISVEFIVSANNSIMRAHLEILVMTKARCI